MNHSSLSARLSRGIVFALVFLLGAPSAVLAQENDALNTQRIIDNLKMEIPQLRQAGQVSLGSFTESEVEGFHRAMLTVNERQLSILVTNDGSRALLLAGPPIDVSRSTEEVEQALADEVSQRGATLARAASGMPSVGPDDAPVTLVEFSDFQCPYCARGSELVDQLVAKYPETLRVVYVHYPLPMHEWARPAAIASQCAARQDEDAFWMLHDAYFDNQNAITVDNVMEKSASFLSDASLDMDEWTTCATDESSDAYKEVQQVVVSNMQAGREVNVTGTPSFYINGEKVQGARSVQAFSRLIEQAAQSAKVQ